MVTRGGRRILLTEPLHLLPERARLKTITYSPTRILDGVKSLSYAANMLAGATGARAGLRRGAAGHAARPGAGGADELDLLGQGRRAADTAARRAHPRLDHAGAGDRRVAARASEPCTLEDLFAADEVFLASTVREVQPVAAIDDHEFPGSAPVSASGSRRRSESASQAELAALKVLTVIGNRPQFIKAAAVSPLLRARARGDAGPHRAALRRRAVGGVLRRARPAGARTGARHRRSARTRSQTARMLAALEPVLAAEKPDCVLVYGDTNSTLAGALAGAQADVPVAHVEAGMRSFDRSMPEELNRVLSDHASALLLCSSQAAVTNLARRIRRRGDRARRRRDGRRRAEGAAERASAHGPGPGARPRAGQVRARDRAPCRERRRPGSPGHAGRAVARGARPGAAGAAPAHARTAGERLGLLAPLEEDVTVTDPLGYFEMTALLCNAQRCADRLRRAAEGGLPGRRAVRHAAAEHRVDRDRRSRDGTCSWTSTPHGAVAALERDTAGRPAAAVRRRARGRTCRRRSYTPLPMIAEHR